MQKGCVKCKSVCNEPVSRIQRLDGSICSLCICINKAMAATNPADQDLLYGSKCFSQLCDEALYVLDVVTDSQCRLTEIADREIY